MPQCRKQETQKTAAVLTMGCKVNSFESEGMAELLEKDGYTIVDFDSKADVYLINTCTVTQIAARKSRQMIHKARLTNPDAIIMAAGCYVDRGTMGLLDGVVDILIPNKDKGDLIGLLHQYTGEKQVDDAPKDLAGKVIREDRERKASAVRQMTIRKAGQRTRAFMKVQDGCRQFCTYCIIPFVRGPLTSRPVADCVEQARILAQNGYKEIVLTGIDLTMYGEDLNDHPDLGDLITAVSQVEGIRRIRLGSLEPRVVTDSFIEKIRRTDKLCPHFHLALQSGCGRTLKAMNRRYTPQEFERAVRMLRDYDPDTAITTDIIVGFPGETDRDHQEALDFVRKIGFAEAHVFRYSRMEGTAAAKRTDQIDGTVKKIRSDQMLAAAAEGTKAFMERMQGKVFDVILEQKESGYWTGYTQNYIKIGVRMPDDDDHHQEEITVRADGYLDISNANHEASGLEKIMKGERQI